MGDNCAWVGCVLTTDAVLDAFDRVETTMTVTKKFAVHATAVKNNLPLG